jgi:DNA-binding Xre family transcriptional regulator
MMSETIKMIMVKRNLTGKDLAEALGCSSQNVYALLKKDRWTLSQLKSLEPVLGAKLYVGFQLNDTKETFGDLNLEK